MLGTIIDNRMIYSLQLFLIHLQELYSSMKGMGTNDQDLIRVITTRAEIDMYYIKMEFQSLYRTTVEQMITSDTSGDYRLFLLTLVGGA